MPNITSKTGNSKNGDVKASKTSPLVDDAPIVPWRERMDVVVRGRVAISVPEAALLLGIGRWTAFKAAEEGSLPTFRVGRRMLVPVAWIESRIYMARKTAE